MGWSDFKYWRIVHPNPHCCRLLRLWRRDNAKGREIGVLGTESLLDSLIVAGVLKEVFRRNRPDEKNPGDFWGGGTSFPSGHAIQIWAIASLLDHEYKHKKIVAITAYSLAGIV